MTKNRVCNDRKRAILVVDVSVFDRNFKIFDQDHLSLCNLFLIINDFEGPSSSKIFIMML